MRMRIKARRTPEKSRVRIFSPRKLTSIYPPYMIVHGDPLNPGKLCTCVVLATDDEEAIASLERSKAMFPDSILVNLATSQLQVFTDN